MDITVARQPFLGHWRRRQRFNRALCEGSDNANTHEDGTSESWSMQVAKSDYAASINISVSINHSHSELFRPFLSVYPSLALLVRFYITFVHIFLATCHNFPLIRGVHSIFLRRHVNTNEKFTLDSNSCAVLFALCWITFTGKNVRIQQSKRIFPRLPIFSCAKRNNSQNACVNTKTIKRIYHTSDYTSTVPWVPSCVLYENTYKSSFTRLGSFVLKFFLISRAHFVSLVNIYFVSLDEQQRVTDRPLSFSKIKYLVKKEYDFESAISSISSDLVISRIYRLINLLVCSSAFVLRLFMSAGLFTWPCSMRWSYLDLLFHSRYLFDVASCRFSFGWRQHRHYHHLFVLMRS